MDANLTVGMTTYDDYDGVFFTVQSLRMYHSSTPFDLIVVDQNPASGYGHLTKKFVERIGGLYIPQNGATGGPPQGRNAYFEAAKPGVVLSVDCHVLFDLGAINSLMNWFSGNEDSKDLVHGPMVYDELKSHSTHWEQGWQDNNFGSWGHDARGNDPAGAAFEISFSGVGVMACNKHAWVGYNPDFIGFGAEEWYLHRKFRQNGGKIWCLPALRWVHRFGAIPHIQYSREMWKCIYNHLLGSIELKDYTDVAVQLKHWHAKYPAELETALGELSRRGKLSIRKPHDRIRRVP